VRAGIQPDVFGVTRIHAERGETLSFSLSLIKIKIAKGRCLCKLKFSQILCGWDCIATGFNKRKFSYLPWLGKKKTHVFFCFIEKREK